MLIKLIRVVRALRWRPETIELLLLNSFKCARINYQVLLEYFARNEI